ncbi:MAG: prefoldin subunit [Nanobdellota archaeon]
MKEKSIQEIQFLEQGLQNILFQKQAFQMELSETKEALKELENAKDEVYKVIGQIMIKSEKSKMKEELLSKIKIFELRMKELEKQENALSDRIEKIRDDDLKNSK